MWTAAGRSEPQKTAPAWRSRWGRADGQMLGAGRRIQDRQAWATSPPAREARSLLPGSCHHPTCHPSHPVGKTPVPPASPAQVAKERAQAGRCGNPLCRAPAPAQPAQGPMCCSPACEAAVRELAQRLGPHSAAQQRFQLMLQHAKRRQRAAQQQGGQVGNEGSGGSSAPQAGGQALASMAAAAAFGPRPPSPVQLPVSAFASAAQRAFSRGFSSALADAASDPSLQYQHYLAAAPTVPARHVLHQPDAQHAQQAAALAASHRAAAQQLAQQAAVAGTTLLAGEPTVIAAQLLHPHHPHQQQQHAGRGAAVAAAGGTGRLQRRVHFTTADAPNDSYWC